MPLRCLTIALCLMPAVASAGAWPAPEGGGQTIVTNTRKVDRPRNLIGGEPTQVRNEVSLFGEYGLTEKTTLGLVISGGFNESTPNGLPDEIDVELQIGGHVRHVIWQGEDGDVTSVQIGVSFPAERWLGESLGDNRPGSVSEAYVSVLYGHSWQFDWSNMFLSTGLEFRARGEGQDEEIKLIATGGVQPHARLLGLLDLRWTEPLGDVGRASLKLTPSLALVMLPWVAENEKKPELASLPTTLQFGATWDAYTPADGIAFNISVWRPF